MRTPVLFFALCLATAARADLAAPPPAPQAELLSIDKSQSLLVYHLIHKMHRVDGKSKAVEGKAKLGPAGAQVMIRVPVESFDSDNVNRDAHMKEAVEAQKYPFVELKAVLDGFTIPAKLPAADDRTVKMQLTFHGITQTIDVPLRIVVSAPNKIKATASFAISLEAFKVERPSLMFVKVDDELKLDATMVFSK